MIGRVAARFELGRLVRAPAPIATHRHDTPLGEAEVRVTLGSLRRLAARMDALLAALP